MENDGLYFSPLGRFACRIGHQPANDCSDAYKQLKKSMYSVHFLDFQKETYREIYLTGFEKCRIKHIHWLDEENIGVFFNQRCCSKRKAILLSNRPMMSFYKLDFSKEQLKPKRTIYWSKHECIPNRENNQFSEGFLSINNKEYFVESLEGGLGYSPETDLDFADLKTYEAYNEKADDYMWIRLIPKTLRSARETQKIRINLQEAMKEAGIDGTPNDFVCWSLFAYKHNLYFSFNGHEFLVVDIEKYLVFSLLLPQEIDKYHDKISWILAIHRKPDGPGRSSVGRPMQDKLLHRAESHGRRREPDLTNHTKCAPFQQDKMKREKDEMRETPR